MPLSSGSLFSRSQLLHFLPVVLFGLLASSTSLLGRPAYEPQSPRQKHSLNLDWKFHRGDLTAKPVGLTTSSGGWEEAVLPHTYQLTSINLDDNPDYHDQPTFHRDISWYRRQIQPEFAPGQRVFLEFEGAHQRTDLWVNGHHVGEHAVSAYTPFHFDITEFVRSGEKNIIALRLDNRKTDEIPPDGHIWDYVLFGGLYRDVYLVVTEDLHIPFAIEQREAGVFVTTPSVSAESATVSVRTTVRNTSTIPKSFDVITRVVDADGEVVLKLVKSATVAAQSDYTLVQTGGIDENLRLWSPDAPYLYRVNTQIQVNGSTVDHADNPLGFRWFEHRYGEGMLLNGRPIKLWGANRHQQFPYIGDAVPDNLHRSDAIKMKESGMNIVRLAHYPHDDAFLAACDELGLLVCEEPPSWIEFGSPLWMDRLEESFRVAIRRHRNHPSVWGWGAGINHRGPIKRLHYAAKEEDSTRITMNNGTVWSGPQHSGITDLYAVMDYGNVQPQIGEVFFAMEHSGSVDTLRTQEFVSRYNADPNRIGGALWSAHDNYSFKKRDGRYPALSQWSAAPWDVFRQPKPNFHWFRSELTTEPMVHIPDARAQHDGTLTVFSNCETVELLIDGISQGTLSANPEPERSHLNSPSIAFPVSWTTGEATARGFNADQLVAEHTRRIPGAATQLSLEFDTTGYDHSADGSSILLAYAWIHDALGSVVSADAPAVTFSIEGPGEIVGGAENHANPITWENGYAPIMVRVGRDPGTIRLRASSPNLKPASTTLTTEAWNTDVFAQNYRPIFEPLRIQVDLGNRHQHTEDAWTPWHGGVWDGLNRDWQDSWTDLTQTDGPTIEQTNFTTSSGHIFTATLAASNQTLGWTRTWGVPGDLSFMLEDAATTTSPGEIILTFENLPTGNYRLKTWHHLITSERTGAPSLKLHVTGSPSEAREFLPSFGGMIQVSDAGVGGSGDGGSNQGARRFALTQFSSDGVSPVSLTISADAPGGAIALSGFDLKQSPTH